MREKPVCGDRLRVRISIAGVCILTSLEPERCRPKRVLPKRLGMKGFLGKAHNSWQRQVRRNERRSKVLSKMAPKASTKRAAQTTKVAQAAKVQKKVESQSARRQTHIPQQSRAPPSKRSRNDENVPPVELPTRIGAGAEVPHGTPEKLPIPERVS